MSRFLDDLYEYDPDKYYDIIQDIDLDCDQCLSYQRCCEQSDDEIGICGRRRTDYEDSL